MIFAALDCERRPLEGHRAARADKVFRSAAGFVSSSRSAIPPTDRGVAATLSRGSLIGMGLAAAQCGTAARSLRAAAITACLKSCARVLREFPVHSLFRERSYEQVNATHALTHRERATGSRAPQAGPVREEIAAYGLR